MPIIPRFQQQFDPNQPPRIDFGDRLVQGLMAGSQMQRSQAEAEWRRATAERYRKMSAQEDEALQAQAAAEMFKAEREFGGVQPRPGQFMPSQGEQAPGFVGPPSKGQQGDYSFGADFVGPQPAPFDYQLGRGPQPRPMSVISDVSPTTAPRVVDVNGQQRRTELDAYDKADFDAAVALAKERGYGPVGTTALLNAVRQTSMERRQRFDIQELQGNFQSAIIGYQKIASELPELGAALEPSINQMKMDADRLDDQMSSAERQQLIGAFNERLAKTNEIVRNERNRLVQYNRTLATVRQARDSYDTTNPNSKLWVDAETEMLLNDRMSVEQISSLMRGTRMKEQGFRQDPITKDWLTEEDLQARIRERRFAKEASDRDALTREQMRENKDFKAHDDWLAQQPKPSDILNRTKALYDSQWQVEEVLQDDPNNPYDAPVRTRVTKQVVDKLRSFNEILSEEEQLAYGKWLEMKPKKEEKAAPQAAGAAPSALISGLSDKDIEAAGIKKAAPSATPAAPQATEQQMTPGEMFALGMLTEEGAKSRTESAKRAMSTDMNAPNKVTGPSEYFSIDVQATLNKDASLAPKIFSDSGFDLGVLDSIDKWAVSKTADIERDLTRAYGTYDEKSRRNLDITDKQRMSANVKSLSNKLAKPYKNEIKSVYSQIEAEIDRAYRSNKLAYDEYKSIGDRVRRIKLAAMGSGDHLSVVEAIGKKG